MGPLSPIPVISVPFPLRLGLAAAVIVLAARAGRPWAVPLAVGITSPALYEWSFLPIWAAAPRLWLLGRRGRSVQLGDVTLSERDPKAQMPGASAPSMIESQSTFMTGEPQTIVKTPTV